MAVVTNREGASPIKRPVSPAVDRARKVFDESNGYSALWDALVAAYEKIEDLKTEVDDLQDQMVELMIEK